MAHGYYLFQVGVSNSSTQSAVAMAAYRSGDKLYSLKDGETKSYQKRLKKPESFILKPDHAPTWTLERETLWNEVEAFEDRDHARLSRNVLLALPNDMTAEQQRKVTEEYVQKNFIEAGMVADTSIHRDDTNNPHAHIMLTVRAFDPEGNWETRKSKRVPKLDDAGNQIYNEKGWRETKSIKLNDWDQQKKLVEWRENWATILNEKSQQYGLEKLYSHQSFEAQGRIKKPEIRLTRNEYQFEKRRKEQAEAKEIEYQPTTYYAKKNEEVKASNLRLSSVLPLEKYKTTENYEDLFYQARKNYPYDQAKIEATKKIAERAKGYVDYSMARNLYNDFHSPTNKWKQKIERDTHSLNAKKEFYRYLFDNYNVNNYNIEKYGYNIDYFEEDMKRAVLKLDKQQTSLEEEINKFKELKEASEVALDHQKELLDYEFKAVYHDDNPLSYDEKNHAIQLMKDHQIKLPKDEIQDDFLANQEEQSKSYTPAWKQAKDTLFTLRIYDKTLQKMERKAGNLKTPDERREDQMKFTTFRKLQEQYHETLNRLEPLVDEELKDAFPQQIHEEMLENTNMETKSFLLEKYRDLAEKEKTDLYELAQEVLQESESKEEQAEIQKHLYKDDYDIEDFQVVARKYEQITEGLLGMFEEIMKSHTKDRMTKNKHQDKTKPFRRKGADGREI